MKFLLGLLLLAAVFAGTSCSEQTQETKRVLRISPGRRIASLDPALAADTASQYMAAAFYDTPLQYNYTKRPYQLEPSMLEALPETDRNHKVFRLRLKKGLLFRKDRCFAQEQDRIVTAHDLKFSILRLADARLKSSGYWLIRDRLAGIQEFREKTGKVPRGSWQVYEEGCSGLKVLDDRTLEIQLTRSDPRFIYALAMPYFSVVSRRAAKFYGEAFTENPVGSGPFLLTEWVKDYVIKLKRNPDFREEYFKDAQDPADRTRRLPLLDEAVCYLVKQPLASWLMFLQGELDYCGLDGENLDAVVNADGRLSSALTERGIRLYASPEIEVNYIGFNCADPVLGKNPDLRRAISLAFDKELRVSTTNGRLMPVSGPVPPGMAGYLAEPGPFGQMNVELAKQYLKKAGYDNGIDPATGRPLELSFDQAGSDTFFRQNAELFAGDLKKIGIVLKPEFSNRSRFFQKLAKGQFQMFRLSWTGDYPDAENFFQLFYGPNADTCNRVFFRDRNFDRMYEQILGMQDTPQRTALYCVMNRYLRNECPWIFESCPKSFLLTHCWMKNYHHHDFGFNRWKYFSVEPGLRTEKKRSFKPLSMNDLRN